MAKWQDFLKAVKEARRNAYVTAVMALGQGDALCGVMGRIVPREIFYGLGIQPLSVASTDGYTMEYATKDPQCPLLKATLGYAESGKCPLLYSVGALVLAGDCPKRIAFGEWLDKPTFIYQPGQALELIAWLEERFSVSFREDRYQEAVRVRQSLADKRETLSQLLREKGQAGFVLKEILFGLEYQFGLDVQAAYLDEALVLARELVPEKGNLPGEDLVATFDFGLVAEAQGNYPKAYWPALDMACDGEAWPKFTGTRLSDLEAAYQVKLQPQAVFKDCCLYEGGLVLDYEPALKLREAPQA